MKICGVVIDIDTFHQFIFIYTEHMIWENLNEPCSIIDYSYGHGDLRLIFARLMPMIAI